MKIVAKERQTVADLGLQYGGSYEVGVELAIGNGLRVDEEPGDGRELTAGNEEAEGKGAQVVRRYAVGGIEPATGISDDERKACPWGGIGYMAVGVDFEVEGEE